MRTIALIAGLVLSLGTSISIAWALGGGSMAFRGPTAVLDERWWAIYGLVALFSAGIAAVAFAHDRPDRSLPGRTVIVVGAWLGQWLVLYLGGSLIANELTQATATTFWWLATGGPIQPMAAMAATLVVRGRVRGGFPA